MTEYKVESGPYPLRPHIEHEFAFWLTQQSKEGWEFVNKVDTSADGVRQSGYVFRRAAPLVEMKLYAFQPRGHGQQSFFVVAASEAEARQAVTDEVARRRHLPRSNEERLDDYDVASWEDYTLTAASPGVVLLNDNS